MLLCWLPAVPIPIRTMYLLLQYTRTYPRLIGTWPIIQFLTFFVNTLYGFFSFFFFYYNTYINNNTWPITTREPI